MEEARKPKPPQTRPTSGPAGCAGLVCTGLNSPCKQSLRNVRGIWILNDGPAPGFWGFLFDFRGFQADSETPHPSPSLKQAGQPDVETGA